MKKVLSTMCALALFAMTIPQSMAAKTETITDDCSALNFAYATYGSNVTADSKYKLSDVSVTKGDANKITYTVPEGATIVSFTLNTDNFQAVSGGNMYAKDINIYGVSDGKVTNLTPNYDWNAENTGVAANENAYMTNAITWQNGWPLTYTSKESVKAGGFNALVVELLAANNNSAQLKGVTIEYELPPENTIIDKCKATNNKYASYGSNVTADGKYVLSSTATASGDANKITYTMPDNATVTSFEIKTNNFQAVSGGNMYAKDINIYGVSDGKVTNLTPNYDWTAGNTGVAANENAYMTNAITWQNGWPLTYTSKELVKDGGFTALVIELLAANGNSAQLTDVKIEYKLPPENTIIDNCQATNNKYAAYGLNVASDGKYVLSSLQTVSGQDNKITYKVPDGAVITDFKVISNNLQNMVNGDMYFSEINIYGLSGDTSTLISARNKWDNSNANSYMSRSIAWESGWPYTYTSNAGIDTFKFDGLAVELLVENGQSSQVKYVEISYEMQPEIVEVQPTKEEILIDDNFKSQKWLAYNSINNAGTVSNDGAAIVLHTLGATANAGITRCRNANANYLLTGMIRDKYSDYQEFKIGWMSNGTPDNGYYTVKKTIANGSYELTYAVAIDGIWVYDTTGWKKVLNIQNPQAMQFSGSYPGTFLDYKILSEVDGNSATVKFDYQDEKDGEFKTFTYSWTMPETTDSNNVTIETNTTDVLGRSFVKITKDVLKNICKYPTLVDDCQAKYDFVKYGSNIEVASIGKYCYSQYKQLDVIEPSITTDPENDIVYQPKDGGYIRDFYVVRRLNANQQGSLGLQLADEQNGLFLEEGVDYNYRVYYLNDGHAYYYYPTAAGLEKMKNGSFTKLVCRLNVDISSSACLENSSAILRSVISYEAPEPYTLKDAFFDAFDGDVTLYATINKNIASSPNYKIIIASYDEEGHLVDAAISEEIKLTTGLCASPTITDAAKHKAFLWQVTSDGDLTMIPILESIEE